MSGTTFGYQWLSNEGTTDTAISGATQAVYTLAAADAGNTIKVRVSFTDDGGTEETLTSAATAAVEATVPDAPRNLSIAAPDGKEGLLEVSWQAPGSDGGSALTGYKVQWRSGSEDYDGTAASTRQAVVTDLTGLPHTISGLTNGVAYTVRVIATNGVGDGAATAGVTGTPRDRVRPELAAAAVDGDTLTLTWNEALYYWLFDWPTSAFHVLVRGAIRRVTEVSVSGSTVTLTLVSAVAAGNTVTVSYTVTSTPFAPRIKDAAGNHAVSFFSEEVTNNTPGAVNTPPTRLPMISGPARVGETLTASASGIAHAEGLSGATFAWQWMSNDGTSDTEIAGATQAAYTLAAADAGKTIKVRVTFTDDGGTEETLTSAATAEVEAAVPGAPRNLALAVADRREGALEVSWAAPAGGAAVTGYTVQWKSGAEYYSATRQATVTDPANLTYTITGLTNGVAYTVRVIAVNDAGDGTASGETTGTPRSLVSQLRHFVENDVVAVHGAAHPWLRAAWRHMNGPGFQLSVYDSREGLGYVVVPCYFDTPLPMICKATAMGIRDTAIDSPLVVVHEMAHVYTLSDQLTSFSAPLGVAHVYFDQIGLRSGNRPCYGHEIYADILTKLVLGDIPTPTWNGQNCGAGGQTQEALSVARSALGGQMPQWFAATYHDADGDPDLEEFWADVQAVSKRLVLSQLRNAFGGYCENLPSGAFRSGAVTRNPWRDGGCVPAAPGGLTATAVGSGKLTVVWDPPAHDGGSPIEGYQLQWKSGSQDYDSSGRAATLGPEAWPHTIDGLTNGVEYAVRVVAYNQNGDGATAEAVGTPAAVETIAPELSRATVTGATLVLTYDEALDEASQPGASAFAVQAGAAARGVTRVAVSGNTVTLTLASVVSSSDEITVRYVVPEGPGAKPIRDVSGNNAASVLGRTVRNDTITGVISIAITSDPGPDRIYTLGPSSLEPEVIEVTVTFSERVTVTFSERVTVTGVPALLLDAGKPGSLTWHTYRFAEYHGGSGTAALTFRYTVSEGDNKPDGVSVPGLRIQLRGGTIRDGANKNAVVTHSGLAAQPGHEVDGARPAPIAGGAVANGTTLTLTFDEALDEGSQPAADAFAVSVAGIARGVTEVAVAGSTLTLTLASAVTADDAVTVSYTVPAAPDAPRIEDAAGNAAAAFSGEVVTNNTAAAVNTPPTGLPAISGTARVGETLTASETGIADVDGLSGATFAWQWVSNDGTANTAIAGATAATYTLAAADAGRAIKVRVTFTDDGGTEETLTSVATATVEATVPDAPRNLAIAVPDGREGVLELSWAAPSSNGGSPLTGYKVQWRSGSEEYDGTASSTRQATVTDLANLTHAITGLTNGVAYTVRVIATNGVGDGPASTEATRAPRDRPELSAAAVDGDTLTLTWSEALDESSEPAAEAFAVSVAGVARGVTEVAVAGSTVALTLSSVVTPGETVTVGYTVPTGVGANPVKDTAGNAATTFVNAQVTNTTLALPVVSIAATTTPVTEGTAAAFTLARTGATDAELAVQVSVSETGAAVSGTPPTSVTFAAGLGSATLSVDTEDDEVSEAASTVTATVSSGTGYTVGGTSGSAEVVVEDDDAAPVADAGADIAGVSPGATVTLDGSGSSDPDRDEKLTWLWTQTDASGYAVVLSDAAAIRPTFTIPSDIAADAVLVFTLRVTDAGGLFAEDSVRVSVAPPPAEAPAAATEVLWSADVTVTDYGGAFGAITADSFTNVTGDELGVEWIWYSVGARRLDLILSEAATDADELTLHLDDVALAFPQGSSGETIIRWRPIRLSWKNGQTVAVRLSRTSHAPEPVNTAPTGLPAISGTPRVGETLTASVSGIADVDGLSGTTFGYQWLSNEGTTDTAISGATQAVYTLAASDAGNTIKVRVTFTDDGGTEETLTSAATAAVEATVPDAPRNLAIAVPDGREGVLELSWAAPSSNGGSPLTGYKVQWRSGSEEYDGTASSTRQATVTDLANLTHAITGLTNGVAYTVRVIATNGVGDGPASTEATRAPRDRDRPELSAAAVDGDTLTLTWSEALDESSEPAAEAFAVSVAGVARGVTEVAVAGSTLTLTLASAVTADDAVTVGYTVPAAPDAPRIEDAAGNAAAAFSGEVVTNNTAAAVNTPPTGLPAISGTARVGETLTASETGIADVDGLSGATFAWQWVSNDGTANTAIAGATAATYTLAAADAGRAIKVRVTFTDDGGTEETLTSVATATVEATVPDAPRNLAIAVPDGREGVLELSWAAPSSNGGSPLTGYKVQWRSGSEEYDGTASSTRQATVTDLANLTHAITGLTNGVAYTVRVIATNGVGDGPASTEATRAPRDRPELSAAAVDGDTLTLTWSEALDESSEPAAEAFAVSVAGVARGVTEVAVAGSTVALTLASAVTANDTVTVSYTVPAAPDAPRIKDAAGNAAAAFSGEGVTNNTAAAVNTPPTGLPTISGTAYVGETLTASASGIADADGLSGATFAWQWIANDGTGDADISGATEASYTLGAADAGKTVKVRVTYTDDGGTTETFVSAATEPVAIPLTARFENVPETHDGATRFTFDLRFSEEIAISFKTVRDRSLELVGGTVRGARRLARPSNMSWRITVDPDTEGDITITLPADRACNTAGAICTSGGKRLSNRLDATVAGPASSALPEVSIAAQTSPVTEGTAAVFTLTRSGAPTAALTVDVAVTESGAMLKGAPAASVTFAAGAGTAALTVETDDDGRDETASTITAAVSAGDGHTVDATAASAAVTVNDDDAAPVVTTASPIAARENDTTVATLAATDADTPAADLAWSIAGGADSDKFTLTAAGLLAFKAAPDFEAPDDADADGSYLVTVRVTDGANPVETTLVVRLSDIDEIAPTLSSATVNGAALTLTFSETLDETSTPATGAFAVTVGTASRGVSGVSVSGSAAVLTLASAVAAGDTVTVGYTVPADGSTPRIRDAVGNAAAGFSGEAVTNATPAHVNTAPTGLPAISGAARVGQTLTASASGIADADGLSGATFAWQWIANDGSADVEIAGATGATYTLTAAELGKTVKLQVTFTDDGGTEETLVSAATGQVSAALTARFENVPERHDGATAFAVRIAFSEAVTTGVAALGDHAAEVTDGSVTGARRIDGRSDLWELSVEPASDAEVTLALPADRACDAAGALCTADGGRLSNRPQATIAGPLPAISIAASASPVAEGTAAAFTLSRSGDTAAALTVAVVVAEDGAALMGAPPANVTFVAGAGTAELAVATDDDETAESASTVTATLEGGDGYAVEADAASASVTVADDDAAPVVTTATPISVPENGTTVATLVATDADTPAADLAWSIAGGADADKFTLTAAGVLAFKAAPNFEAPDDAGADGEYEVAVTVTDGANPVEAELTVRLTDVDDVEPVLTGASVDGATVTLTFDEALDESSVPPAGAFAVTVGTASRGVSGVSVDGSATLLTLASAVTADDTVEVTYSVPAEASARIRDTAGNAAAGFSRQAVTNATPVANTLPAGRPAIAGTPLVGATLTASADGIEDADGLAGAVFAWQWIVNDGSGDADIAGATQASHTLTAAAAGKRVKVRVTFTDDGGTEETLLSAATATVSAPLPEVSIVAAASPVTEGNAAVFVLRRSGATTSALTVAVSVTEAGDVLDGAAPSSVTFAENAAEARLRIATEDDAAAEADARVTATLAAGAGYRVAAAAAAAGVDVFDDEQAPSSAAVTLWSGELEVGTYGGWIGALGDAVEDNGWTEDGVDYALDYVIYVPGELLVGFTRAPEQIDGLTLHFGELELALADAGSGTTYAWSVELDWEPGMTVAVLLNRQGAAPAGPGVSVADATVREAAGAALRFRVTLEQPQATAVSVRYASADGTAVAGADYLAVRGALRFAPGETTRTVAVAVLDDAHEEGAETLRLTLTRPFGALLSDAEATGTIDNADPLPRAWLARFGRTAAEQVLSAVEERLRASVSAETRVTLAGHRVPSAPTAADPAALDAAADQQLAAWLRGDTAATGSRILTMRELLSESAFQVGAQTAHGGTLTLWGGGAFSRFGGGDGAVELDGDVWAGLLGVDYAQGGWLAGLALAYHESGGGSYRSPAADGALHSWLVGGYPYVGYAAGPLALWGAAGYGQGKLTLTATGDAPLETGIGLLLGAGGARGELLAPDAAGGAGLAVNLDALVLRTSLEATPGLAAAEADVSRLRLGLEGSYALALGSGGRLTPTAELAVRHDGGHAETGFGLDLSGSLRWSAPALGLAAQVSGHGLLLHEAGFPDWGVAGSFSYDPDPASDLGLSLSLAPAWGGTATSGADALHGRPTMAGLTADAARADPGARITAEAAYGLPLFGTAGVGTPYLGLGLADGSRDYRLGYRLTVTTAPGRDLTLSLEGTRHESTHGADPQHTISLQGTRSW